MMLSESTDFPDARVKIFGGCFIRVLGAVNFFMGTIGAAGLFWGNAVPIYVFVLLLVLVINFIVVGAWFMFGQEEVRIYGEMRKIEIASAFGRWRRSHVIDVPVGASIICTAYANLERYGPATYWRVNVQSTDHRDAVEIISQVSQEKATKVAKESRIFIGEDLKVEILSATDDANQSQQVLS